MDWWEDKVEIQMYFLNGIKSTCMHYDYFKIQTTVNEPAWREPGK